MGSGPKTGGQICCHLEMTLQDQAWSLLSLHQIPKAEEGIPTEVTTNQAFDLIASPVKSVRALSERVTARRVGEIRVLG